MTTGSRVKRKNRHAPPAVKNRLCRAYGFRELRGECDSDVSHSLMLVDDSGLGMSQINGGRGCGY